MKRRTAIWIGTAIIALFAGSPPLRPAVAQQSAPASSPASQPARPDPNRFADEIARFGEWDQKNSFPHHAVLFVGSSSIRFWPTHTAFPDLPVINRGFGGSHISDVNHFFDQVVAPYHARVIVFYAGDNDIAAGFSAERVREDFADFVRRVRAIQPTTPIVFLTIKPSGSRMQFWPQMQHANDLVRDMSRQDTALRCVDVGAPLLDADGKPRDELFQPDHLHLNAKGYAVWQQALEPALKELLASR